MVALVETIMLLGLFFHSIIRLGCDVYVLMRIFHACYKFLPVKMLRRIQVLSVSDGNYYLFGVPIIRSWIPV